VSRADFLKLAGGLTAAGIASAFPSAALAKKMVEIEDDDEEEEGGGLFGGVTKMFRKKPAKRSAQQDPSDVPQQLKTQGAKDDVDKDMMQRLEKRREKVKDSKEPQDLNPSYGSNFVDPETMEADPPRGPKSPQDSPNPLRENTDQMLGNKPQGQY